MSHIRPIFLIAGNTVTGVLRGVVLNVLLVLAAILVLGAMSSGAVGAAQMRQTLVDSGLAVITILGAMIAILTGFTMIPGEIESRTLYPVISKPVRRWQFVLGKFFGAAGVNGITLALLSILFFVVYFVKIHQFDPRMLLAVVMIYAMLTVLSGLIIFFSTFMSWIGTIIVSSLVWFIGSYSQFFYDMAQNGEGNGFSKTMLGLVQKLLPNFQAMDLRYDIVQLETISFTARRILEPIGSASIYLIIALMLAILIFNYREL
ncbi:MAG TPA: ABC transporter permease subunit [Armatimonadota bacterium]|jgi:ABC-type transport system involved in multi-copper enzyme maturation permease subunit